MLRQMQEKKIVHVGEGWTQICTCYAKDLNGVL